MPEPDIKSDDYYKILGLDKGANDAEIKKAYRKLAMKWHPDKNADNKAQSEENFKKISEAFEVLSDEQKRKTYDQFGKQGLSGGGGGGGGGMGGMPGGMHFQASDPSEIFNMFFGGQDPFAEMFGASAGSGGFQGMGGPGMHMQFGGPGGGSPINMQDMMGGMGGFGGFPGMGMGMPGMKGKGKGNGRPTPFNQLKPGTKVVIRGLQSAPQHNGKSGLVEDYTSENQRYSVGVDGGDTMALKFKNLLAKASATITGIESKPELNGKKCEVFGLDEASGRYKVQVTGVGPMALSVDNLVLGEGALVTIDGLGSKPELNGNVGQIRSFDEDAGRYVVKISNTQTLKLKASNLIL